MGAATRQQVGNGKETGDGNNRDASGDDDWRGRPPGAKSAGDA
jgi:hypothetical protein